MADEVVDAQGRLLGLRRLSVLDRLRLYEAAGAELSRNDRWLGLAVLVLLALYSSGKNKTVWS